MKNEKIILPEDVFLPSKKSVEVFKMGTENNPRYVITENTVRKELSTHRRCECGEVYSKHSYCRSCSSKREKENYLKKPFKEWDGETPLAIYNDDTYFWDEDSIIDYMENNEIDSEDLQLVICSPNYLNGIDLDYWADYLPENIETIDDFDKGLSDKIAELNYYIRGLKPISWSEGIYRTTYEK